MHAQRWQQLPWPLDLVLDALLAPLWLCAVIWVRRQQALVLRLGVALTSEQMIVAQALGVVAAEHVRVMCADVIPMPLPRFVHALAQRAGWILPHIAGMTLGYGIVLREDCCHDRRLLAHELAHVVQYERLGGCAGFLRQYVRECVWPGYPRGALEIEARTAEARGSALRVDVIPYHPFAADRAEPPTRSNGIQRE